MRSIIRAVAALAIILFATSVPHTAQDSETTYKDTASTVILSSVSYPFFPFGFCIIIFFERTNTRVCTVTEYEDQVISGQNIQAFFDIDGNPSFVVTNWTKTIRVVVGSTSTPTTTVTPYNRSLYLGGVGFLIPPAGTSPEDDLFFCEADSFSHDYDNSVVATFDGVPIARGEEVKLTDYGPGTYSFLLVQDDGVNVTTNETIINVDSTHELVQVDLPVNQNILPTAAFTFTNEWDQDIDLFLQATSNSLSLDVYLENNIATVAPGQTIQREVQFATTPGHGIPEGGYLSATIDAYCYDDHLSSIKVLAALNATTKGHGEDTRIQTDLNGIGLPSLSTKPGSVGDTVSVTIDSPGETFLGDLVVANWDSFALGTPIVRLNPNIPYHLSANAQPLFTSIMSPAGATFTGTVPPSMVGLVMRVQAAVHSTQAANGSFTLTDAFDFFIQ